MSNLVSYSVTGVDDEVNYLSCGLDFANFRKNQSLDSSLSFLMSTSFMSNVTSSRCNLTIKTEFFLLSEFSELSPARLKITDFNNHLNGIEAMTRYLKNCSKCKTFFYRNDSSFQIYQRLFNKVLPNLIANVIHELSKNFKLLLLWKRKFKTKYLLRFRMVLYLDIGMLKLTKKFTTKTLMLKKIAFFLRHFEKNMFTEKNQLTAEVN